jgi:Domain of unknown function (DUF4402)
MQSNFKFQAIKLVLAGAFAVTGISATAAGASADAGGSVITPITVTKTTDLVFGRFAHGAGAGSVTVSTSGARTGTGVILSTTGATPGAASFTVTGAADATYSISQSGSATLTGVGDPMALTKFSNTTGANEITGDAQNGILTGGTQIIYIGGTLTVSATQATGTYAGTVGVAVEYN